MRGGVTGFVTGAVEKLTELLSRIQAAVDFPEEVDEAAVGAQVRVQVDAGDYHSRQDSRLQELARALADKVRATGRSQSTRPLSAYQRRVIHLTLQDDPDVQTRSSGEGPLKRVVILRRKD